MSTIKEEKKEKEKEKTFSLQLSDIMKSAEEDRSLEMLFMLKDKRMISDLTPRQISALAKINALGRLHNCKEMIDFSEDILTTLLSKDRKSREEVLKLNQIEAEGEQKQGFFSRWFGGRNE